MGKSTDSKPARNTAPSPMEHVSIRLPNLSVQRARLAREAQGMTVEQIQTEAASLQVPLGDAKTKDDLVAAVQAAVVHE